MQGQLLDAAVTILIELLPQTVAGRDFSTLITPIHKVSAAALWCAQLLHSAVWIESDYLAAHPNKPESLTGFVLNQSNLLAFAESSFSQCGVVNLTTNEAAER